MKKQFYQSIIAINMVVIMACQSPNKPTTESGTPPAVTTAEQPTKTGDDADAHGCRPSAGYQWSVVRNSCVRLFETGIRLEAKSKKLPKEAVATVLFKSDDDDAQAELFLPNQKESLLLNRTGKDDAGTWRNDSLTLSQWRGMYTLENKKKEVLYEGAATH